jgi:hypothetical protein
MRRLDLKSILSEAVKCVQTFKTGEVTDTELERITMEFLNGLYAHLPKDLQPIVIAELKAKVLPLLLETDTVPMNMPNDDENDFSKANGISIEELIGWTVQKIVLPVGLGFLIFLITRYVNKA